MITRTEGGDDVRHGIFRVDRISAGEDINGRVPVLGPSVDTEVRFSDGDDAGDALRAEFVERVADYRGPDALRGRCEHFADQMQVIERFGIAISEFQKQMGS